MQYILRWQSCVTDVGRYDVYHVPTYRSLSSGFNIRTVAIDRIAQPEIRASFRKGWFIQAACKSKLGCGSLPKNIRSFRRADSY